MVHGMRLSWLILELIKCLKYEVSESISLKNIIKTYCQESHHLEDIGYIFTISITNETEKRN